MNVTADPTVPGRVIIKSSIADRQPSLANDILRWINEFYAGAPKGQTRKARIDQSVRDQLKALGYIR